MNYIKDVELFTEKQYNMVVEITKGSRNKNELVTPNFDKLECVRKSLLKYPFYYGCFPQTLAGDGDALDAILISSKKHKELDIVEVLPIAVIKTIDNGEIDDKVICVDGKVKHVDKVIKVIKTFLHLYKGKNANMIVDDKDYDVAEPLKLIQEAHERFLPKTTNSLKVN